MSGQSQTHPGSLWSSLQCTLRRVWTWTERLPRALILAAPLQSRPVPPTVCSSPSSSLYARLCVCVFALLKPGPGTWWSSLATCTSGSTRWPSSTASASRSKEEEGRSRSCFTERPVLLCCVCLCVCVPNRKFTNSMDSNSLYKELLTQLCSPVLPLNWVT